MFFRGLLIVFLSIQVSAQESTSETAYGHSAAAFAEVAKLAKSDTTAAVELLRTTEDLDPEMLYRAFDELDAVAHLHLLNEICKDEALANRFVFGWMSLGSVSTSDSAGPQSKDDFKGLNRDEWFHSFIERQLTAVLDAAPEDMPPVLLIPAVGTNLNLTRLMLGVIFVSIPDSDVAKERAVGLLQKKINIENIPPKYDQIIKLFDSLSLPEDGSPDTQQAQAQIADLLEDADIPLSVRLGFAQLGSSDREDRSDEIAILTVNWLSEALERDIPVNSQATATLLKRFVDAHRHPDWKAGATRILNASAELNSNDENCNPWLVGIAAILGDRIQIEKLTATAAESTLALANDPVFFLLVRAGYFDLAEEKISQQNRGLLLTRSNNFLRRGSGFSEVMFDSEFESQTSKFIETITNSDVKFITELHLKLLPDHPEFPPQIDRDERARELATRLRNHEFKEPAAKHTALRMIGNFSTAAAEIAETYIEYSQFDRVDKNLNDMGRGEEWVALAADTFNAVLVAEKYDDAMMILNKVAASTARLDGDFRRSLHNKFWEKIVDGFSKKLTEENSTEELLPLARFLNGLPRKNFFPTKNFTRGSLIKNSITKHAEHGQLSAWYDWHSALPPTIRKNHDLQFIDHILQNNILTFGSDSWLNNPLPEPEPETIPYFKLIHTIRNVPYDESVEARTSAAIRACNPDTPAAIAVFYNLRYLSANEILENADRFISALPDEGSRKWNDLAQIAHEAKREELTKEFSEKAENLMFK